MKAEQLYSTELLACRGVSACRLAFLL